MYAKQQYGEEITAVFPELKQETATHSDDHHLGSDDTEKSPNQSPFNK